MCRGSEFRGQFGNAIAKKLSVQCNVAIGRMLLCIAHHLAGSRNVRNGIERCYVP